MPNGKFIIQCEKCKKPILKDNPNNKRPEQLVCLDIDTNEPITMPNVYCKFCKHLNLITKEKKIITESLKPAEKKELNKKIKEDILN